jgi:phenylacetic acid degradation operon negative regulatory protein
MNPVVKTSIVKALIERLQDQPSHTGSLIITVFGDAIMPRGGQVAMATILELMEALGIQAGVVRTAISRLAANGWIASSRQGRMSFYCIGPARQGEFIRAARHVFGPARRPHAIRLSLAMPGMPSETGENREDARLRLARLGFVPWQGMMIAPERPLPNSLAASLPLLTANASAATMRVIAAQAWRLDELAVEYAAFLHAFAPLSTSLDEAALDEPGGLSEIEAILARLLLVHEFRRIVLRDPRLPDVFLPEAWPGAAARRLAATMYPALLPASELWLDHHGRTESGPLPRADIVLFQRFNN